MRLPKNRSHAWVIMVVALIFLAGVQFSGCSDSEDGQLKPNQPPKVWLSSAPPEGSMEKYTIQLFWGGWDPDGEIAYYEYAITDNDNGPFDPADTTGRDKWGKVFGNDSIFMFTADVLADTNTRNLVTEFTRSHTFFIRAVDGQGLSSNQPEYRSFTARTLSPMVSVIIPPGGSLTPSFVPPITTFSWMAQDYIDDLNSKIDPDSVSWILEPTTGHNNSFEQTIQYIRNLPVDSPKWNEWGGWKWYGAPQDSGKIWTSPPLEFDPYIFAIRAKDEAGAITPVFDEVYNVRRIQVSERSTGPILTVENTYLGAITTAICNEPVTIMDLPAGIPVSFCWRASADHYGGIVTGYRYGWDIEDLSDPDQWEIDYTPFTASQHCSPNREFYFGTHTFTIEVVDNSGYCSRIEIKTNIVQFTMENDLLVVDDYREGTEAGWDDPIAPGLTPNDAQHDSFWESMLFDVAGFSPARDVIQVATGDVVPLTDLAKYKSIIWSVFGHVDHVSGTVLHEYIRYRVSGGGGGGKRQPNVLALFLAAGGHLFISGNHPVSMALPSSNFRFPIIFAYELEAGAQTNPPNADTPIVGERSFAYHELCLETMDFARTSYQSRRSWGEYCPVHLQRTAPDDGNRLHTMRGAEPVDLNFPRLDLRIEAAGVGRVFHVDSKGLDVEVYNPQYFFNICPYTSGPRDCWESIYALDCLDTGEPTYAASVAFWTSAFADRIGESNGAIGARSVVFGFPPVFFNPDQVRGAIEAIVFDEWQLPRRD